MNLILSDVEETITLVDVGDDGGVANVRVSRCLLHFFSDKEVSNQSTDRLICLGGSEQSVARNMEMLFVRGDAVIMASHLDLDLKFDHPSPFPFTHIGPLLSYFIDLANPINPKPKSSGPHRGR